MEKVKTEINLNNLVENALKIKSISKKDLIAVVKSNAYGFGCFEVVDALRKAGVNYFAVLDFKEAKTLLEKEIEENILLLNSIDEEDYYEIKKHNNIVLSVNNLNDAILLNKIIESKRRVHIQIDTGMRRLGAKTKVEFNEIKEILLKNPFIEIEGVYTHFCGVESATKQLERFKNILKKDNYKMIHCAASCTMDKIDFGNYVRVGLALYGALSGMKNIITVKVKPLTINSLEKNTTLGYLEAYKTSKKERIAVLPVGYADGFFQAFQNLEVYVGEKSFNVVGRICMNHIYVRVDDDITLDSEFVLISEKNPIYKLSQIHKISPYEICTGLNMKKTYKW
ncbi:MAG: alanine racemase [Bacilli bacterium]